MKFSKASHLSILAIVSFAIAMGTGCGKKKKSSDSTEATTTDTASVNGLSLGYPDNLNVSVFPTGSSTSLAAAEKNIDQLSDMKPEDKLADNEKALRGEADNCLSKELFMKPRKSLAVTCYDFDSDMDPMVRTGAASAGTSDGTNGSGEACMVTFARNQARDNIDLMEKALALVKGMMCQVAKNGDDTTAPEPGEAAKDLKPAMKEAAGPKMPVTSATMSASLSGEDTTYTTALSIADPSGNAMEITLYNTPKPHGIETGILTFKRPAAAGGGDQNNIANKNEIMSIEYEINTNENEKSAKVEVRRAALVNTIAPFDGANRVNYAGMPKEATNAQVHAINYVAFDLDPETAEGSMSYWMNPGGSYNESARGFLFESVADADGKLSGCGVSGATGGVSIRKALLEPSATNVLKPVRFWHPFASLNTSSERDSRYVGNEGPSITKQCFAQNAAGVYAIDKTKTTSARGYDVIGQGQNTVPPPRKPGE